MSYVWNALYSTSFSDTPDQSFFFEVSEFKFRAENKTIQWTKISLFNFELLSEDSLEVFLSHSKHIFL